MGPQFNPMFDPLKNPYGPPPQTPIMPPQMGGPPPVAGMPGAPGGGMPPMAPPGTAPGGAPGMPPPQGAGAPGAAGAGLDPKMLNAVLSLQGQDSQRSSLEKQYALADQLRADAKSQTQQRGAGWGNAAASIAEQFAAKKMGDRADAAGLGLDKKATKASRGWLGALTGKKIPDDDEDNGM